MKTALHLTLLNSFFLLCPANAVPPGEIIAGSFQQIDFDGGGWLTGIAAHPGGRLYARTDVGGAYRSDDRGATWRFLSGDLPTRVTHYVQALAVSEDDPDVVFQAVGDAVYPKDSGRGVWKSTDGGASWTQVLRDVNFSGNGTYRFGGECLSVRRGAAAAEVWAGTRGDGLWRSTEEGAAGTWVKIGGKTFDALRTWVVHLHPKFPRDLYVGGERNGGASALFRSADAGTTWSPVGAFDSARHVSRVARLDDGQLFAAVETGASAMQFWTSSDGAQWTDLTGAILQQTGRKRAHGEVGMCHALRDGRTVVVGWLGGPTVRSSDGGATWTAIPLEAVGEPPVAILPTRTVEWSRGGLTQDPRDPQRWYLPNAFGPLLSNDAGETCSYLVRGIGEVVSFQPAFHPHDADFVFLPVADLIGFIVTDGGRSGAAQRNPRRALPKTNGNVPMTYARRILVGPAKAGVAPKLYFIGGANFGDDAGRATVLTTSDLGQTWQLAHLTGKIGRGLPSAPGALKSEGLVDGAIAPDDANELIVAMGGAPGENAGGIYRSADGGATFTQATGLPGHGAPAGGVKSYGGEFSRWTCLEADPTDARVRYGWVNAAGFYRSDDRGATWKHAGHSAGGAKEGKLFEWNTWGALALDRATGRLWFGGLEGHLGLAHSSNGGADWTYLDRPFAKTGFEAINALDAHDHAVVVHGRRYGDAVEKIYYSPDDGTTWREITQSGHRHPTVDSLALDPHHRGRVWIANAGRSVTIFTPERSESNRPPQRPRASNP